MYLYHFDMNFFPFGHTPNTKLFCATNTHIEAMNVLLFSINNGESFCKITGEIGSGKTMLCRLLLNKLENKRTLAYIPNPNISAKSLQFSLAKELGLKINSSYREDQISQSIQTRLIKLNKKNGAVVLIIDEAQTLSEQALETLRLFTNIETEQEKLLQIVLFAQPELDRKLNKKNLRQIKQRISFSYTLKKLNPLSVVKYIKHRLSIVSNDQKVTISSFTCFFVCFLSRGTPRLINVLCHKALLLAYAKNKFKITTINIIKAAFDTDSIDRFLIRHIKFTLAIILLSVSSSALAFLGSS